MLADTLIRKNLLPDPLIRLGIRRLLKERLKTAGRWETVERRQQVLSDLIRFLKESPIAVNTADANEQHYEVPAGFYQLVLGKRLKYSCGYWPAGITDLNESEEAMLKLTCERARIQKGQKILDLGCGWGSLSLYLAEYYPDCDITALSNSATQRAYIEEQARLRGFSNLRVITANLKEFHSPETFDRIVSIEMFEHMRNYELLLAKVSSWMKPGALLFVYIFTHVQVAYLFEDKDPNDWMTRYFFSGGIMPSDDLLLYFQNDLSLAKHWQVDGRHYQKTSEAWLQNADRHKERIFEIFKRVYGPDQVLWRWSYWRVFFMACAELWGYAQGQEWVVSHYLFKKVME